MMGASMEKGHGACGTQGTTEGSRGGVRGDYGDGDSDSRSQWGRFTIPCARQQAAVQDILVRGCGDRVTGMKSALHSSWSGSSVDEDTAIGAVLGWQLYAPKEPHTHWLAKLSFTHH